jgi:hypothetical protein
VRVDVKTAKCLSIQYTLYNTIPLKTTTRTTIYIQMDTSSENLAEYVLSLYPVVLAISSTIGDDWKWKWEDRNRLYNSVTRTCKAWRKRNVEWATCAHYMAPKKTQKWNDDLKLHAKFLQRVYTLNLLNCVEICDVSALGRVHDLCLCGCTGVRDVSALGGVHSLHLWGCTGVCDVSALGGVYYLNLGGCTGVRDVSALGNVYDLNLSGCTGVRDVSALGSVHTLDLSWCTGVCDASALGSVYSLCLYGCTEVADTSMLGGVYTLTLPNGDRKIRTARNKRNKPE